MNRKIAQMMKHREDEIAKVASVVAFVARS
jgi:hypothetical protein